MDRPEQSIEEMNVAARELNERARRRCQLARQFEEAGDYETARRTLSPFWKRVGERPRLTDLEDTVQAEVLQRAGALTGWIGSSSRLTGAQETAKDLISEARSIFERFKLPEKAAEAEIELATCYWREGAFDEARILLQDVLNHVARESGELRGMALLRLALVENSATRFTDSLRLLTEAAPYFESLENPSLKGRFHATLANNLQCLGTAENRTDYMDRALVEYTAASFYYQQSGNARYRATVENNLGFLFFTIGRLAEAHDHLDRARKLLVKLNDQLRTAQVDDTRARVLLAQQRYVEAEKIVRAAVAAFEQAGEMALLTEALTTQATALARMNQAAQARSLFESAMKIARQAGSVESAGLASLALLEEMDSHLTPTEKLAFYQEADQLLSHSQQPEILLRLREAARRALQVYDQAEKTLKTSMQSTQPNEQPEGVDANLEGLILQIATQHHKQITFTPEAIMAMRQLFLKDQLSTLQLLIKQTVQAAPQDALIDADAVETVSLRHTSKANFAQPWAEFSLKSETYAIEKRLIELALKEAQGRVSVAAKLLGLEHPERLSSIIKSRHSELLKARTPVLPRRRSIIRKSHKR